MYYIDAFARPFLESLILKIILLLILSVSLLWVWSRRKLYILSLKLPGPISLPIVGNAFNLGLLNNHKDYITLLRNLKKQYGEILSIWLGPEFCVVISEPSDIENVLLSKQAANKGPKYDVMASVTGKGLLTGSGIKWKNHRHIINPAFNGVNIKSYQNVHDKNGKRIAKNLMKLCNKGPVDVTIHCLRWSADIVLEALFSHEPNFYEGNKDDVVYTSVIIGELVHERMCKVWLSIDWIYYLTETGKRMKEQLTIYRNYYHKNILKIVEKYKNNVETIERFNSEYAENDVNFGKKLRNPLDLMINALIEGKFTEQDIVDEFDNIFNPGVDTCYTHLSFFILMMGVNKRCQDLLWKEIKEVFSDDIDAPVTTQHISKMTYLDMCLKETTRLFPTGPIQMRITDEDFMLKKRDLTIPAGTSIMISNFIIHREEKYWDSPDLFIPERFLPENSSKRPHFAYIPFSAGLRNCIAQVFGHDMLKTAIIHMLRNMEFHSDLEMKDVKVRVDISTRCALGYFVKITKRNRDE